MFKFMFNRVVVMVRFYIIMVNFFDREVKCNRGKIFVLIIMFDNRVVIGVLVMLLVWGDYNLERKIFFLINSFKKIRAIVL